MLEFSSQPLVYVVCGEARCERVTGGNTIFTHILAPLDGSRLAECVLPHAVALARGFDARLTVLHVIEPPPDGDDAAVDPLIGRCGRQRQRRPGDCRRQVAIAGS
ncbi:MAG: universal stress protein [Caldilineaceae bacterium]|nr:universal stress protein [Caldilineaceae bacterium]